MLGNVSGFLALMFVMVATLYVVFALSIFIKQLFNTLSFRLNKLKYATRMAERRVLIAMKYIAEYPDCKEGRKHYEDAFSDLMMVYMLSIGKEAVKNLKPPVGIMDTEVDVTEIMNTDKEKEN